MSASNAEVGTKVPKPSATGVDVTAAAAVAANVVNTVRSSAENIVGKQQPNTAAGVNLGADSSSTKTGGQHLAGSGTKYVIRKITIDPRKLQGTGFDRKLAEAISKQRATTTQAKAVAETEVIARKAAAATAKAEETSAAATAVAATTVVETSAAKTATISTCSNAAAKLHVIKHVTGAVATASQLSTKIKNVVPKITITGPNDSSTPLSPKLITDNADMKRAKNLLQQKILRKQQNSPSSSSLPSPTPPMQNANTHAFATSTSKLPTMPTSSANERVANATKTALYVDPKTMLSSTTKPQTLPTFANTTAAAKIPVHNVTAGASIITSKKPTTDATEIRKLPLDVRRIVQLSVTQKPKVEQAASNTHVQSYENFLKTRAANIKITSTLPDDDDIDEIPKASIKTRVSLSREKSFTPVKKSVNVDANSLPSTSSKAAVLKFPEVSPLKQPYPTVSLPQDVPLPNISTLKNPLLPATKMEYVENAAKPETTSGKQPVKSLIVLEDKLLSQDEKIDLATFCLAHAKPEIGTRSSSQTEHMPQNRFIVTKSKLTTTSSLHQEPKHECLEVQLHGKEKKLEGFDRLKLSQDNIPQQQQIMVQIDKLDHVKEAKEKSSEGGVFGNNLTEQCQVIQADHPKVKKEIQLLAHKLKVSAKVQKQFSPIPEARGKERKYVILPVNKLKLSQDKIPAFAKEIKLKASSNIMPNVPVENNTTVATSTAVTTNSQSPSHKDAHVAIQTKPSNSAIISEKNTQKMQSTPITTLANKTITNTFKSSSHENALNSARTSQSTSTSIPQKNTEQMQTTATMAVANKTVDLEFKEPLPPSDQLPHLYSSAYIPRKKSTVEIIEKPEHEPTISAVDFIASLANSNPITEETELELSPEELNLTASFAMNLSPIRIPHSNDRSMLKQSADDATSSTATLPNMFSANSDVEIGKIITIPNENVLKAVITADKPGNIITISTNESITTTESEAEVPHEDHTYQHKGTPECVNALALNNEVSKETTASTVVVHDVKLHEFGDIQLGDNDNNETKQVNTSKMICNEVADTAKVEIKPNKENDAIVKSTEKSTAIADMSTKRISRFRKGKINLVQRKKSTNPGTSTAQRNSSDNDNTAIEAVDKMNAATNSLQVEQLIENNVASEFAAKLRNERVSSANKEQSTVFADISKQSTLNSDDDSWTSTTEIPAKDIDNQVEFNSNIKSGYVNEIISLQTPEQVNDAVTSSLSVIAEDTMDKELLRPSEYKGSEVVSSHLKESSTGDINSNISVIQKTFVDSSDTCKNSSVEETSTVELLVADQSSERQTETKQDKISPTKVETTAPEIEKRSVYISQLLNPPKILKRNSIEKTELTENQNISILKADKSIGKTVSLIQPKTVEVGLTPTPAKNPFRRKSSAEKVDESASVGIRTLLNHMETAKLGNVSDDQINAEIKAEANPSTHSEKEVDSVEMQTEQAEKVTYEMAGETEKHKNIDKKPFKKRLSDNLEEVNQKSRTDKQVIKHINNDEQELVTLLPRKKSKLVNSELGTRHSEATEDDKTEQIVDHAATSKHSHKRKREALDDRKKQTEQQQQETESDSEATRDMCNNKNDKEFLGFDDQSPTSNKIKKKLQILKSVTSAEEESCEETKLSGKQHVDAAGATTLKTWLTTGKAISPTRRRSKERNKSKERPAIGRRSSVPLKKRWELSQTAQKHDIEITDDESPIDDVDEQKNEAHSSTVKRKLSGMDDNVQTVQSKKAKVIENSAEEVATKEKNLQKANHHSEKDVVEHVITNKMESVVVETQKKCGRSSKKENSDLLTKAKDLETVNKESSSNVDFISKKISENESKVSPKKHGRRSRSHKSVDAKLNDETVSVSENPEKEGRSKSIIEYFESYERQSNTFNTAIKQSSVIAGGDIEDDSVQKKQSELMFPTKTSISASPRKMKQKHSRRISQLREFEADGNATVTMDTKDLGEIKDIASDEKSEKKCKRKSKSLERDMEGIPTPSATVAVDNYNNVNDGEHVKNKKRYRKSKGAKASLTLDSSDVPNLKQKDENITVSKNETTESGLKKAVKENDHAADTPTTTKNKLEESPKNKSLQANKSIAEESATAAHEPIDIEKDHSDSEESATVVQKKKRGRKAKSTTTISSPTQNLESKKKQLEPPKRTLSPMQNADTTSEAEVGTPVVEKKKRGRPKRTSSPVQHVDSNSTTEVVESTTPVVERKKPGRKPKVNVIPGQNADNSVQPDAPTTTPDVGKKPGKPIVPFNPRLLLITNRAQLDTEEPLTVEPGDAAANTVQCGVCLAHVVRSRWLPHLSQHYGVGWILGKMPEINLTSRNAVLNAMVNYHKDSAKDVKCRMCGRQFRSALGTLLHIENCGAPEVRVTCEYCGKSYTPLSLMPHKRTCAARRELEEKEDESVDSSQSTTNDEILNNVGRVKRASVKKAEKRLKVIGKELVGSATTMSEAEAKSHIKYQLTDANDLRAKWMEELQHAAMLHCVAQSCDFEAKDLSSMETHYETCAHKAKTNYRCALCQQLSMFSTEQDAIKHILRQHKTNANNDFEADDSDCGIKTDDESSGADDDILSGVDSNESDIETKSDVATGCTTKGRQRKTPKASSIPLKNHHVYSNRSSRLADDVARSWKKFKSRNYTKETLFTYAKPVYEKRCLNDVEKYLPSDKTSMKFCFSEKSDIESKFGAPEQLTWSELCRFKTMAFKNNHFMYLGGPVKTLAWVPLPSDVREQYLLVSYRRDWQSYTRFQNPKIDATLLLLFKITSPHDEKAPLKWQLHYAVFVPDGPVHCFAFMPSGGYDVGMNRLGLLAVGTASNVIKVYSLPLTVDERAGSENEQTEAAKDEGSISMTVIELKTVIALCLNLDNASLSGHTLADAQCVQLCWSEAAAHSHIFVGFSSGCVGIWDISNAGEENINCFMVDGVHQFVPLNFFYLGEKTVRAFALHYDTIGPRWFAAVVGVRKILVYDIRDLMQPILMMEDSAKNIIHSLDWSPLWEPVVAAYGDSLDSFGRLIMAINPVNLLHTRNKIDNMLSAVSQVHYNPFVNVFACVVDNGDIVCLNPRELHFDDVLSKAPHNYRAVSTMDLKQLDGTAIPHYNNKNKPPAGFQPTESNYKEKYGLVFGPLLKFKQQYKTSYSSAERKPSANLERYMRSSTLRWNLNNSAHHLMAIGYENGFVRLMTFKPQEYFKR